MNHVYGFIRSAPKPTDLRYTAVLQEDQLPSEKILDIDIPVWNQADEGACSAFALGFTMLYINKNHKFTPAWNFLYYNERMLQNTIDSDSGSTITIGIEALKKFGLCSAEDWPYSKTTMFNKPSDKCYEDAIKDELVVALNLNTLHDIKHCISENFPVAFGFQVFSGFESPEVAKTGVANMPTYDETYMGGHATAIVGYSDSRKAVKVRNSWGPEWGDKGYFWLPYEYVTTPELASDFWTLRVSTES